MTNTHQSSDKRKAELLKEIYLGLVEVDQRIFLLEQKMFGKANFNPGQPRVPAGNPRGGEWVGTGESFENNVAGDNEDIIQVEKTPVHNNVRSNTNSKRPQKIFDDAAKTYIDFYGKKPKSKRNSRGQ